MKADQLCFVSIASSFAGPQLLLGAPGALAVLLHIDTIAKQVTRRDAEASQMPCCYLLFLSIFQLWDTRVCQVLQVESESESIYFVNSCQIAKPAEALSFIALES